ncbi:hypothetical protein DM860_015839 [Cuscuta australis]|uniref:Leucine-rich repeat-containing N-terminal plant-type domain-containing protein n=1 Tax=Cuscuta australis TaxID=267555 RepID=A0A328DYB4_9ASTE|nr:hypothetical protein DM860_015839 [Cuscuta australis]
MGGITRTPPPVVSPPPSSAAGPSILILLLLSSLLLPLASPSSSQEEGNGLSGEIPKELGNLKKLVTLNLSQNNLTGSIPIELCNIATLRNLWLDDNKLTGEVPAECFRKQNFVFNGNPGLIGVPATPSLPTDSAGPNSTPPKRMMGWMVVITTISLVSPWVVKRRHETDC